MQYETTLKLWVYGIVRLIYTHVGLEGAQYLNLCFEHARLYISILPLYHTLLDKRNAA